MRFLLTSIGSRGDIEPFLAIGEILKNKGHEVTCMFPEQYGVLAIDSGFQFISLGPEFIDMLHSPIGRKAMGGSSSALDKFRSYLQLAKVSKNVNKKMIRLQVEHINSLKVDRIIHNPKVIYPTVWGLKNPGKHLVISPVPYLHYTKGHTHLAFNSNWGTFLNKASYKLAEFGLVQTIMASMKYLNINVSRSEVKRELRQTRTIYTISPKLFPRPSDWSPHLSVLGYHERDKTVKWTASEELKIFLSQHKKILFFTFGSMTNPKPDEFTQTIIDVVTDLQIPTIINQGEGGLTKPENFNDPNILFVERVPYDYIFPKMYAVVHHGGSGTTHMALKHACANMVIPHIIDQFLWNKINAEKGAGPLGFKVNKLNYNNLIPLLHKLWHNKEYKLNAERTSKSMRSEDLEEQLYNELIS